MTTPVRPTGWSAALRRLPRGLLAVLVVGAVALVAVGVSGSCAVSDDARCDPECAATGGSVQCRDFALDEAFWPADASGRVVVRYRVVPEVPPGHGVTPQDLVEAVQAAAAAWEAVDPVLDLVYDGEARGEVDRQDGVSVIGFAPSDEDAVAFASVWGSGADAEVDVVLLANGTRYERDPVPGAEVEGDVEVVDLQSVLTHELGHLLGLDHPDAGAEQLTMSSDWLNSERFPRTPALGDVLGVRELYPCGCPLPAVQDP